MEQLHNLLVIFWCVPSLFFLSCNGEIRNSYVERKLLEEPSILFSVLNEGNGKEYESSLIPLSDLPVCPPDSGKSYHGVQFAGDSFFLCLLKKEGDIGSTEKLLLHFEIIHNLELLETTPFFWNQKEDAYLSRGGNWFIKLTNYSEEASL